MQLVALRSKIDHLPRADDFILVDAPRPPCPDDGVVVRIHYLSLDPYVGSRLRGRHMGEAPPAPMTEAAPGSIVGEVAESRSGKFREGDFVQSMAGGWSEYAAIPASGCRKVDPAAAPLSAYVGVLGMPGLTAWAGVSRLAAVRGGETFLVDAAAGAVGGTAGQIARILGAACIIGVAGGREKCSLVESAYRFDACIDYRKEGWRESLKAATGDPARGGGVDVFFENVSAAMAATALSVAKPYVRGVLCGLVANYHDAEQSQHPINAGIIIGKRAKIMGLVVYDFYPQWDEFASQASGWLREGKLTLVEDRASGLDAAPGLFEKLMDGRNVGKCVVEVAPEES